MSLNDPQWGRGKSSDEQNNDKNDRQDDNADRNDQDTNRQDDNRNRSRGQGDDLDRLWEEFNRALGGMLGQPERGRRPQDQRDERNDQDSRNGERQESRFDDRNDQVHPTQDQIRKQFESIRRMQPNFLKPKSNGKGLAFALVVALGLWGATGFYIVPEGQSGIVTTFGKYTETTMPGFRWHLPWPVQNADIVDVSSVRTVAIGAAGRANREAEALMLTDDENIVDLRFNVQYRIKAGEGAMNYLFRSRHPDESVRQTAESAMREVVGRRKMDSVLFESKQEIAEGVKRIMQDMLDRYHTGIEVMSVAIQNAQPPQPVQAAFNDAVKAGQDRERQINEGEAYANAVIPKAHGMAARLQQEAEGYKTRVVETATGDAERFSQILAQYEKAPQVTRDRMYVDMMQQVLQSTTKVYVDTKDGNNLLYLPFDKLMEQNKTQVTVAAQDEATSSTATPVAVDASQTEASANVYNQRSLRDRSR
jgi:membrane protease subunit HflK